MGRLDYIIDYEDIAHQKAIDIKKKLNAIKGIKIGECKISDLVICEDEAIETGNGVYFFRIEEKIVYVGSCSARNFVERIPAHFDIRSIGWFNSLLKAIARKDERLADDLKSLKPKGRKSYHFVNPFLIKVAKLAFKECSVVLINFKGPFKPHPAGVALITALEDFLLESDMLNPGNRKGKWAYKEDQTLHKILTPRIKNNLDKLKKRIQKRAARKATSSSPR